MLYTMLQAWRETGMTYQALKFYCNEGLVPNVKRDKNNRRVFDARDIAWINSLTRLKKCGRRSRRRCARRCGNYRRASPISTGSRISTTKSSPASARMRAI